MNRFATIPSRSAPRLLLVAVILLGVLLTGGLLLARPRAAHAQSTGTEVFGLQGTLREAVGQPFTTYLVVDSNGRTFGLYGRTPEIDQQIESLRELGLPVKVWGTLYPQGNISNQPEIVVDTIAATGVPAPTAVPTATPAPTPQAVVNYPQVNARSGPSTDYPVVGVLNQGTTCPVDGRNSDATWARLVCQVQALIGWVSADLLSYNFNLLNAPVIAVDPPPPPQFPQWKASYFGNSSLQGAPTLVRNEQFLNFEWGTGSPAPSIPVDNFSARFERVLDFSPGNYRISATMDDGARVWVNNELVIDSWTTGARRTLTADRWLSGSVPIRVEYFENAGDATLIVSVAPADFAPTPTPAPAVSELPPQFNQWAAAYWNNTDLSGGPVIARYEPRSPMPLDLNWGTGSPAPQINADNFSARWQGLFDFSQGDHIFRAISDDGVRVFIDGILVIDAWTDGYKDVSNRFNQIGAGRHTITVQYYERFGNAQVQVSWWRDTSSGGGGSGGGGSSGGFQRD